MSTTASEALYGYNGLYASFAVLADDIPGAPSEFSKDIKSIQTNPAAPNSSDLTFEEAKNGGASESPVQITCIQSLRAGSFWRFLFDNQGKKVRLTWGPEGNAVATEAKPHLVYDLKINALPPMGGQATLESTRFEAQVTLDYVSGPTLDEGA